MYDIVSSVYKVGPSNIRKIFCGPKQSPIKTLNMESEGLLENKDNEAVLPELLIPGNLIKRRDDVVTVVMFSSDIDSNNKALSNCIIEKCKWKNADPSKGNAGTEKARAIAKAFESVVYDDCSYKLLRIININSVKVKGTIPRKLVKEVLEYLHSVRDAVDLVYFPSFKSVKEGADIFPLLYDLKQSAILVCSAIRPNDIPTKEAIAVRVVKGEISGGEISGATDLAVDILEDIPLDGSALLGPCTVLGIAAGFLHNARTRSAEKLGERRTYTVYKLD